MTRLMVGLFAVLAFAGTATTDDKKEPTPAERLKQLKAERETIEKKLYEELRADRTNEGVTKANDKYNKAVVKWRDTALPVLRKHPELPESLEIIIESRYADGYDMAELIGYLRKHHTAHPDLGKSFLTLIQDRSKEATAFIEEMAEKSSVATVRAQAAYYVGWYAKWRIMQDGENRLGFGKKLTDDEQKSLVARAEKYLGMASKYDDATMAHDSGKVGPTARGELLGLKNLANLKVGKTAPDIAGEGIDGKKFKLSDSRGKVVVVVFWASWCGPCMKDVPHEKELVERLKDAPFALIGVNGDDKRDKAKEAAKRTEMTWPSFWDAAERPDGPITKSWNVHYWPTVYILDHKGVIRFKDVRGEKLDAAVDALLKEMEVEKKAK